MLTIRLQRRGRKNDPSFRVILVESKRAAKTGNYQEMLGSYDARVNRVDLKADRIKHWMSMGATVSDTVHNLLVSNKIIDAKKINVLPRKSPPSSKTTEDTATQAEVPASKEEVAEGDASPEALAKGDNAVAEEAAAQ